VKSQQDPFNFYQWPTCEICIANNSCGWCELNIHYINGSIGPQCAGKPKDPDHPPPGYVPWTCPGPGFQNLFCPSYECNNSTFKCEEKRKKGPTLMECRSNCFPPTYLCNKTDSKCYITQPGIGTDLPSCQKDCVDALYKCNKENYQCEKVEGGDPFQTCLKGCFPPTYECDKRNYTCYQTVPGNGTDIRTCETTCNPTWGPTVGPPSGQILYNCDETSLTCQLSQNGQGQPKDLCDAVCGAPKNVTPDYLIGDYRGLMINVGYTKGEWTAQITQELIIIKTPDGKVWIEGRVATYANQLWIQTNKGTMRGLYAEQHLPEVLALTWGLGEAGAAVPESWGAAMKTNAVFSFGRCLNTNICQWILSEEQDRERMTDMIPKYNNVITKKKNF